MTQDESANLGADSIALDAAQIDPEQLLLERAELLDSDYKERGYMLFVWRYADGLSWAWFV
jgi:hypothetical protein